MPKIWERHVVLNFWLLFVSCVQIYLDGSQVRRTLLRAGASLTRIAVRDDQYGLGYAAVYKVIQEPGIPHPEDGKIVDRYKDRPCIRFTLRE